MNDYVTFIAAKEVDAILKELYAQCSSKRVDEGIDICISHIKHLESGYHVVGANYTYILETVHNRKSFIYCFLSAIKGFDDGYEVTTNELYIIIETICLDFPKGLLMDAMLTTTEQYNNNTFSPDNKYPIATLARALICHILYDEWLKALEETFRNDGKAFTLSGTRIRSRCEQCYRNLPKFCPQPPYAATQTVYDEASKNGGELSFERFKKTVFNSEAVQTEIRLLSNYPSLL
ncbi:hypothetical protein EON65_35045 [archaeon]|nr:MAG: hypothetical protein EON65_35045 [archaeon]